MSVIKKETYTHRIFAHKEYLRWESGQVYDPMINLTV